jgi:hypothetical protein
MSLEEHHGAEFMVGGEHAVNTGLLAKAGVLLVIGIISWEIFKSLVGMKK